MRYRHALAILAALPAPALAQNNAAPSIVVTSDGTVDTPPDIATLTFAVRGEGSTADEAVGAMTARQKAVLQGLRSLDHNLEVSTGAVTINEAYSGNCTASSGRKITLSTGDCAITGRVARIETTVVMNSAKDAGTAIGLAGRLGAANAEIQSFGLRDPQAARRRAVAAAATQARARAQAIADASGAKLGPIISVTDYDRGEIIMYRTPAESADGVRDFAPPIIVEIDPKAVKTTVQLTVTFGLEK